MKEAAFVAKNSGKWKEMEEGDNLTPDQVASHFIELTDDHSDKNVCNQLIYRRFLFVVENVVEFIYLIALRFK